MSTPELVLGSIGWTDLTVPDADLLRDFYQKVAGWTVAPIDMGGYSDYVMQRPDGTPAGGICHARGPNAELPPVWIPYITIADLDASLAAVRAGGGTLLVGPKSMGPTQRYAVIRDPAGAVAALFESRSA